uniref:Uncharacterized protein n=1 Tax=Corethron hystrix TaxID=216773 RepID=A0A7S1BC44_9STRA
MLTKAPFYDAESAVTRAVPRDPKRVPGPSRRSRTKGRLMPREPLPVLLPGLAAERVARLLLERASDPARFLRKKARRQYLARVRCTEGPSPEAVDVAVRCLLADRRLRETGEEVAKEAEEAAEDGSEEEAEEAAEEAAEETNEEAAEKKPRHLSGVQRAERLLADYAAHVDARRRHKEKLRRWEHDVRRDAAPPGSRIVRKIVRGVDTEIVRMRKNHRRTDFVAGVGTEMAVPEEVGEETLERVRAAQ